MERHPSRDECDIGRDFHWIRWNLAPDQCPVRESKTYWSGAWWLSPGLFVLFRVGVKT
jgi:hypothetical protein